VNSQRQKARTQDSPRVHGKFSKKKNENGMTRRGVDVVHGGENRNFSKVYILTRKKGEAAGKRFAEKAPGERECQTGEVHLIPKLNGYGGTLVSPRVLKKTAEGRGGIG